MPTNQALFQLARQPILVPARQPILVPAKLSALRLHLMQLQAVEPRLGSARQKLGWWVVVHTVDLQGCGFAWLPNN